jgi:hypothetical protein
VLLAAFAVGCSTEVVRILPKQDGTWTSASIAMRSYVNSTLDSSWTITDGSTYTFEKGGSGTRVDVTGGSHVFTWSGNPDGDIITLCDATVSTLDCQNYLVVSSSKDLQKWKATIVGSANGEWMEQDLELVRAN